MENAVVWPLLHGLRTGPGPDEWLVPVLLASGSGTAVIACWWTRRRRVAGTGGDRPGEQVFYHDEPI